MNKTPLPSAAAPPYICEYIPLDAVRLMTGVHDPIVSGRFNMSASEGWGSGGCFVYQPTGNKPKVLDVTLSPGGSEKEAEFQISQGARRLPEIVPGAVGYYGQNGSADNTQAAATLVRGHDLLIVELVRGVKGRDNTADVVALMKLVAPKLIPDATPSPKKTKG
ncbi:hypothetical protein ABT294_41060 [Nonomuraea sp. NPDC000554]|uniref:hypothetical protein n=1 Tax=Nonomuraea sp. NPDC000554 TaxID=3154259 RepID=UPI003317A605